jgi:hypothetical protein
MVAANGEPVLSSNPDPDTHSGASVTPETPVSCSAVVSAHDTLLLLLLSLLLLLLPHSCCALSPLLLLVLEAVVPRCAW